MSELSYYISDPKNGEYNFSLARWYENQGHTAAAAGFYIRTTEFSSDNLLIYEALLRIAICFTKQGGRTAIVKGALLRAVSLFPDRPEAYFLLSQAYEVNKEWQEAYTWACMGEKLTSISGCVGSDGADAPKRPRYDLYTDVGYHGKHLFVFEKAVSGWWCGLMDESLHLFRQLNKMSDIKEPYAQSIKNNLKNLSDNFRSPITYYEYLYEKLRVKFTGANQIKRNYSQCYQDMFVLIMLDGKKNGKFLEIGCGEPFFGNNTALLEELGWTGISIDMDEAKTLPFSQQRKSKVITADATKINYNEIITEDYDYLQIDCDPALVSLEILFKIPFEKYKFSVITFEHDDYCSEGVKERSRKYLTSLGYVMIVGDIAPDKYMNFEDWWVHPDMIRKDLIEKMKVISDNTKKCDDYMLG